MQTLKAPAPRTFPTVDQGTYTGTVQSIVVQDWTSTPDTFGNQGHYTLVFTWRLDDLTEDGQVVTIPHYVRFETGERPYSKGQRAGKLPWLTEITRALGVPDVEPDDEVDVDEWEGKRVRLAILAEQRLDGTIRNKVNAVLPVLKKGPRAAARAVPVSIEADLAEADMPF